MYLLLSCHHWTTTANPTLQTGVLIGCDHCPPLDDSNPHATMPQRQVVRVTVTR